MTVFRPFKAVLWRSTALVPLTFKASTVVTVAMTNLESFVAVVRFSVFSAVSVI